MVEAKIIYTIITVVVAFVIGMILKGYIGYKIRKYLPRTAKTVPFRAAVNLILVLLTAFALLAIWGVKIDNLWIYLTSVLGLIAIGFFAVWSVLSNLFAGIIILSTKKLRRGDAVVVLPEKIKGKVDSVGLFFITLKDRGYITYVPNNMFFQRFVKVKPRKGG